MELWQVRKEYRLLAMRLRRRKGLVAPHVELAEEQVLSALVLCDRFEVELCVLKLARRCARARLKRLRRWVESSGLYRTMPRPLSRREDEPAADELAKGLEKKGIEPHYVRQLLAELIHLDRRLFESRERLERMTALGIAALEQLFIEMRMKPGALS